MICAISAGRGGGGHRGTVGMVVIVGATMVAIVVMAVAVLACASVPVQVGHIMVVVLVGGIQHDAEVADVQTRLLHPGYLHSETFHRQALQRRRTASSLAPASSRAAAHMSPLIPEVHSK